MPDVIPEGRLASGVSLKADVDRVELVESGDERTKRAPPHHVCRELTIQDVSVMSIMAGLQASDEVFDGCLRISADRRDRWAGVCDHVSFMPR